METFYKVQKIINGGTNIPIRQDINEDFPLRGFVACTSCGRAMTSCWSHGSHKKYAYYWCNNRNCGLYRSSHSAIKMHGAFEALLRAVRPTDGLFDLAYDIFKHIWDQRSQQVSAAKQKLRAEIKKIDKQITQLLDRIIDTQSATVINAYEKRIADLEKQKLVVGEKLAFPAKVQRPFSEMFERSCEFLSNPLKIWDSGRLEDRQTVLKLLFQEPLAYAKNEGFRTPKLSLPFSMLGAFQEVKKEMVPPERLELSLSKEPDFESGASTNSATGAHIVI